MNEQIGRVVRVAKIQTGKKILHGNERPEELFIHKGNSQWQFFSNIVVMDEQDLTELKRKWERLLGFIEKKFDVDADLQGIIFLIGVQELGAGAKKYTKDEKEDLMHIATCKLLSRFGYYELEGKDEEGWPHWKNVKQLPVLTLKEQDLLLRQSVIAYFEEHEIDF